MNSVETEKKETEKMPMYPSLEKVEAHPGCSNQATSNIKQEEGNVIHTNGKIYVYNSIGKLYCLA